MPTFELSNSGIEWLGETNMLTMIPAYNRDYREPHQVLADFLEDKDFMICDVSCPFNGKYANRSDLKEEEVKIRYNKLQDFVVIDVYKGVLKD
jgi:hypothetical protein